jgi:DNA-binding GntR family transcriptional regulator
VHHELLAALQSHDPALVVHVLEQHIAVPSPAPADAPLPRPRRARPEKVG